MSDSGICGHATLRLKLDPRNLVDEYDEDNNIYERKVCNKNSSQRYLSHDAVILESFLF